MIQFGGKIKGIQFGGSSFGKTAETIQYSSKGPNIEKDSREELDAVTKAYSDKAKAEKDRFKENTDANYFTVVTFNNSDQLKEFLNAIGLTPDDNQFIDGLALSKKLGIEIKTASRPAPGAFKSSKALKDLV